MIGDRIDFRNRLIAVLPGSWFPDVAPIRDAVLDGLAGAWVTVYMMLQYVISQARISSASDIWLDLIAWDFFGWRLKRRSNESDDTLRGRIMFGLFCERATRLAVASALQSLTGNIASIFEPARTTDTGGYASLDGQGGGVGYGAAGGWGSLNLPFQCFVTAYRSADAGIGQVAGWGCAAGGYRVGSLEYASSDMVEAQVTDAEICFAVAGVLPIGTVVWIKINN
jgi:hypothetical protein